MVSLTAPFVLSGKVKVNAYDLLLEECLRSWDAPVYPVKLEAALVELFSKLNVWVKSTP